MPSPRTSAAPRLCVDVFFRIGVSAALALMALLHGCAARRSAPADTLRPPPFITTFWCGPPLAEIDDRRAAEIVAAGFTVIGAPCEGMITADLNRRALDVAARHGLTMWIMDHRYNPLASETVDDDAIVAAVADYAAHPAFGGYFVLDEPNVELFAPVQAIVETLRRHDPEHLAYVNLLPDYVKPEGLGAEDYAQYVDQFIDAVQPRLLSYDYYPFGKEKDRSTFFNNLTLVRERALRHRIPFMLIILAMPHGPYREPSESEMAWQAFHALAYGARGLSYFTYWTPVHVEHADEMQFRYGMIENGRPTAMYFRAQRINTEVRALAAALDSYRSIAVGDALGDVAAPLPIGPLEGIDGGAITVGFFADARGRVAALLANRDYRYATEATLRLRSGATAPEIFDTASNQWNRVEDLRVSLPPGSGRLLRWP